MGSEGEIVGVRRGGGREGRVGVTGGVCHECGQVKFWTDRKVLVLF